MGADRIGHGVACVRDSTLMRRLATDRTTLEVSPCSNVALGLFDSLESHPLPEMWEAGLNVTINSDDPPFFSTTLANDLRRGARLANLSTDELVELQRRAARAAFAPADERSSLEERVAR
ncbi:MAG: hypothetical protein ACRDJL_01900 [Actinomycetota bacterium]